MLERMTDEQLYLYDTVGYLVLDDVLTRGHCQRLVDELKRIIATPVDELPRDVAHGAHTECEIGVQHLPSAAPVFADLIDLPPVIDVLQTVIHKELRLETAYGAIRRKGFKGLNLHGGGHFDGGGQDFNFPYRHFNGRIFSGNNVVTFNLTDVSEEEGGFVCIPGSHKANFPIPEYLKDLEKNRVDGSLVRSVACKAGSVVVFPEALCHGASPWTSDRERINLFYKYNHVGMKFRSFYPAKESLDAMTKNQRKFYSEVASDWREARIVHPGR